MPLTPCVEHRFTFHGFTYAVQCWGKPSARPLMALHGWLDNSESFSRLAQYLDDVYLIVPDLAGHGFTEQRSGYAEYSLWSEVNEICAIADALKVKNFALLGHSRGAMMAHIVAAIIPERITHLILLDAITPIPVTQKQMLPRLRQRFRHMTQIEQATRRFKTRESAINARCESEYGGISQDNAERLATRGLSEAQGEFFWHADSKLKVPAGTGITAEQIEELLSHVSAPTLAIVASQGLMIKQKNTAVGLLAENVIRLNNILVKTMDDGHFLHMSDSAQLVAQESFDFINTHRDVLE